MVRHIGGGDVGRQPGKCRLIQLFAHNFSFQLIELHGDIVESIEKTNNFLEMRAASVKCF
jgi:hypothetical protein